MPFSRTRPIPLKKKNSIVSRWMRFLSMCR